MRRRLLPLHRPLASWACVATQQQHPQQHQLTSRLLRPHRRPLQCRA
jgi:hypothetical protein